MRWRASPRGGGTGRRAWHVLTCGAGACTRVCTDVHGRAFGCGWCATDARCGTRGRREGACGMRRAGVRRCVRGTWRWWGGGEKRAGVRQATCSMCVGEECAWRAWRVNMCVCCARASGVCIVSIRDKGHVWYARSRACVRKLCGPQLVMPTPGPRSGPRIVHKRYTPVMPATRSKLRPHHSNGARGELAQAGAGSRQESRVRCRCFASTLSRAVRERGQGSAHTSLRYR